VLSGLVKRISKSLSVLHIEDRKTVEQFLDAARAYERI
jgi:acyl-CoA synthetase (NDP forming)